MKRVANRDESLEKNRGDVGDQNLVAQEIELGRRMDGKLVDEVGREQER